MSIATRPRHMFCGAMLAIAVFLMAIPGRSAAQDAKKDTGKKHTLTANFGTGASPPVVLVQLYQDGKLMREREVGANSATLPIAATFTKLAAGRYEVHFEGRG